MMRFRILPLLVVGLASAGAVSAYRLGRPAGALHDLERAQPVRGFTARLSIPTEYRACSPAGGTVPRERCGENEDAPFDLEALAAARESLDPDTLRAAALAAVIWWDGLEASQNAAVALLADARRLSPNEVPVLVDLSGVHLVRAQRTQNPRDLVAALDAALEALMLDPKNPPALFNAALALQSLGIDEQAVVAWDRYLAADSASPWAHEARQRRRALLAFAPVPREPTPATPAAAVHAFAARDPERARLLGWNDVLGRWGGAALAGDTSRAEGLLRLAEQLGGALERRGGDASLADAVRAIHAARGDARATRTLARAHRAYAAGQLYFPDPERLPARDSFALVLRLRPASPALLAWARAYHAATLVYAGRHAAAGAVVDSLLAETDSVRHPALLARLRWTTGTPLLRASDLAAARERFASASAAYARLGEAVNFGATRYLQGEAAYEQGDTLQAYAMMHQALTALRPHRASVRLHNVLMELAECAAKDGMPWAAMRIQDEDVAVAVRTGYPMSTPEALLARARLRTIAGRAPSAMADLDSAAVLVDALGLDHITHTLRFTRAVAGPGSGGRYAVELDSAVGYFAARQNVSWLLPTLMRRADLRLALGDWAGAGADLDSITARIRTLSRRERDYHLRAAMMEQARSRFDQRVMLHVRNGRPREALRALERGRTSLALAGGGRAAPPGRMLVPPDQAAVAYALIGDTLLAWTVRGNSVSLLERRVDRNTLLFDIERAGAALERPERAALAEAHLRRLYDLLILPLAPRLGPAETPLSILADGEIAGVPFAALRDARRGRYLVQDHPLRFVATLADATAPAPAPLPGTAGPVLLVADPAFDPRFHPTLDRLTGAGAEVESLRPLYPGAYVLRGAGATSEAVGGRARGAALIHFAGHAVFDDTQPERSFLVLAGEGRLSADAVSALDLRGVRLVVLSACRTMPSRAGRSDGIAGLSGALLSAGAGGVVGSLWRVDDRLTQHLMLAFHRQYARSASDPAGALRQAQLAMLGSADPARRSPAAWAGFRYIGG